jgi:hypothetical protein
MKPWFSEPPSDPPQPDNDIKGGRSEDKVEPKKRS